MNLVTILATAPWVVNSGVGDSPAADAEAVKALRPTSRRETVGDMAKRRPLLLDLYCGAGGAAVGYERAGFDVIGVDIEPQPDYPFEFHQGDALECLESLLYGRERLRAKGRWAAAHASPPCQHASGPTMGTNAKRNAANGKSHPALIAPTRALLTAMQRPGLPPLPYVIENVQGAVVRRDLTLCGEMFGLDVIRHRYFECSFPVTGLEHVPHRGRVRGWRHGEYFDGPYMAVYGKGGGKATLPEAQKAMGIDWTENLASINEAIPPAYTEYVGRQLMSHIRRQERIA